MFNKIFDDSQVVVFDERGNIIRTPTVDPTQDQKLEKDPDATPMFETYELADGKVKSVWYRMLTLRKRALLLTALIAVFFIFAGLIKYQVTKSNKKYNETVQSRTARGCTYPTMVVQGSKEGYAVDPDEGCAPE